ncbi:MAG TPA: DUF4010 domain-containing protein, partial [Burkholderiaceae bacterium]|nr:DUF4010 domain-containing protein [Burkholderiaceae bacterium]
DNKGLLLTGLLGGLVSSTATTFVYARHAQRGALPAAHSRIVIALANCAMLARVWLIVLIIAPRAAGAAALVLVPALALAAVPVALRRPAAGPSETTEHDYRNPANLLTSLLFGAGYAVMLLASAWLSEKFGSRGVYGLAVVSGLTDVDAITLSSLRLLNVGTLELAATLTAIAVAVGANLVMKATLVAVFGGTSLRRSGPLSLLLPLLGLVLGAVALQVFL